MTSLATARDRYFEENGFGPDGGYDDAWVEFKLGAIPFPFPNTPARRRAIPYHDLHHVVTGYRTDFRSELEISAWELGAGCGGYLAAWQLDLVAVAAGWLLVPRRLLRAFARGRRCRSLYRAPLAATLARSVDEARAALGLAAPPPTPTAGDAARLAAWGVVGWLLLVVLTPIAVALLPLAGLAGALRKKPTDRGQRRAGGGTAISRS